MDREQALQIINKYIKSPGLGITCFPLKLLCVLRGKRARRSGLFGITGLLMIMTGDPPTPSSTQLRRALLRELNVPEETPALLSHGKPRLSPPTRMEKSLNA